MTAGALAGVRVVAFEVAAAGPFASHLLADMGAEVIKVERPGTGDIMRQWDSAVKGLSSGYVWLSRNKRSVTVDAQTDAGRDILRRLADRADVWLENFAPGAAARLGLSYADLAPSNPRLIYCSLSGYGQDGPYRAVKAFDLLIQGEAGIIATTGYPDAPAKVGVPIADIAAGMYAAMGIVLALYQRERTGRGQAIDVAMFETMLEWLGYFPHHYWHRGEEPERVGMRHHYVTPYGPYKARNGQYVNVAVASARDWLTFCERVLERPDLLADPRFATVEGRRTNRGDLEATIEGIIASADHDVWLERLRAADLPYGEVRGIAQVLAHPQVAARQMIREVDSPVGRVPVIGSPLRLSDSPARYERIPDLGEDTAAVLAEIGYDEAEIARLRARGVV
jgi:crotonobetainyl-CoA:carnitine CoA-transferase CaiB-like acyl-CoA transferase